MKHLNIMNSWIINENCDIFRLQTDVIFLNCCSLIYSKIINILPWRLYVLGYILSLTEITWHNQVKKTGLIVLYMKRGRWFIIQLSCLYCSETETLRNSCICTCVFVHVSGFLKFNLTQNKGRSSLFSSNIFCLVSNFFVILLWYKNKLMWIKIMESNATFHKYKTGSKY